MATEIAKMVAGAKLKQVTGDIGGTVNSLQCDVFSQVIFTGIFTGRFVCDFAHFAGITQVVLFITLARGFNEIHCNFQLSASTIFLLSFAEIAEINTFENMSP